MAQEKYNSFITPKRSIVDKFSRINKKDKTDYMARLSYSIQAAKYLLRQGLASRGHDESQSSLNKGNFLELIDMSICLLCSLLCTSTSVNSCGSCQGKPTLCLVL
jgi:hypothetical protein